ncbi:MAG: hypothetical protein ABI364_07190 [Caldimonas sp.]
MRRRGFGRRLLGAVWPAIRAALLALVAVVIFVEEWGWRPLSALVARLAVVPPIAWFEAVIRRSPPRVALALFLVPAGLLVPVKLLALWLIEDGRTTLGIAIIVAAKLVGTAFVGRLFVLVEPQLMSFPWFARCAIWWRATRDRLMARLHQSMFWRSARVLGRLWREGARRLLSFFH